MRVSAQQTLPDPVVLLPPSFGPFVIETHVQLLDLLDDTMMTRVHQTCAVHTDLHHTTFFTNVVL
jgi:hypothetical protein